jgi:hypothetical protein
VNLKQYPRLRIRKLYFTDGGDAWGVMLFDSARTLVAFWYCSSYDQVLWQAPAIWADRDFYILGEMPSAGAP